MNNKILIVSDKKPGHLNQSIAFCKLKGLSFDIVEISNSNRFQKILTYILDFFNIYVNIFNVDFTYKKYRAVVSTGSLTYYTNKYISKKLLSKSIAIMLPKGFRYEDFDYIIASSHDNAPKSENIISIPLNLSINNPNGLLLKSQEKSVGIIIGGNNSIFTMTTENIKNILDDIFKSHPNHLKYVTTSRRTPEEVDKLLEDYNFDYEIIYSKIPTINPIPDFIEVCDELYITIDSTSMLSESRANSDANIHIINLESKKNNTKFHKLANNIKNMKEKFDYMPYLEKIKI